MKYAPVIIPTLNRYDHLTKCLESLNKNHNADKTEVYISVDYPPSEEYKEGHGKICEYLENQNFVFKKLHIIRQTENLGVISKDGRLTNSDFLIHMISRKYDRWIYSEDDNVFSPSFLDFVNMGLEQFKDDKTVLSICGYRFYYNMKIGENNFIRQSSDFNAWGHGVWRDRQEMKNSLNVGYLRRIVFNPFKMYTIRKKTSNTRLYDLICLSYKSAFRRIDNFSTILMINENMCQIMPAVSLVRNMGWDGTGQNCNNFENKIVNNHIYQTIDDKPLFEKFIGSGYEFYYLNNRIINEEDYRQYSNWLLFKVYLKRIVRFWK